jgi:hypothetical protein
MEKGLAVVLQANTIVLYRQESILAISCLPQTQNNVV